MPCIVIDHDGVHGQRWGEARENSACFDFGFVHGLFGFGAELHFFFSFFLFTSVLQQLWKLIVEWE